MFNKKIFAVVSLLSCLANASSDRHMVCIQAPAIAVKESSDSVSQLDELFARIEKLESMCHSMQNYIENQNAVIVKITQEQIVASLSAEITGLVGRINSLELEFSLDRSDAVRGQIMDKISPLSDKLKKKIKKLKRYVVEHKEDIARLKSDLMLIFKIIGSPDLLQKLELGSKGLIEIVMELQSHLK